MSALPNRLAPDRHRLLTLPARHAKARAPAGESGLATLGWIGIARLGLVQASLGAVVVLATGTLNRIMVLEMGMPALVPGVLIAWHYLIQILRPRLGHGSDRGGRRTPWIIGGVLMLGLGAVGAASATALMSSHPLLGVVLAFVDYSFIGVGVGCAGTSLLVLLAQQTAPQRRPAAATVVWMMMILGFVLTAGLAGKALEPYSRERTLLVIACVAGIALLVTTLAVWGIENRPVPAAPGLAAANAAPTPSAEPNSGFFTALAEVWAEPAARRFSLFVFVAMLAYSAQELLLDPFAGAVYGMSPGASTRLSGVQHGGALLGMVLVALLGSQPWIARALGPGKGTLTGCAASALMLVLLGTASAAHLPIALKPMVFFLGVANGCFAVSAIATMMQMVGQGARRREGVRMGLWGAAQAVAFAAGGITGTGLSDLARALWADPGLAYGSVFLIQAVLFVYAAWLAHTLVRPKSSGEFTWKTVTTSS